MKRSMAFFIAAFALAALLPIHPAAAAELVNIAPAGTATQSSEYPWADGFPARLAIDLDFLNFTATGPADPAPTWQVDLPAGHRIAKVVLHNRGDGCCPERLRDITVSILDAPGGAAVFDSDLLNPANALGGPRSIEVDLAALTGGTVSGQAVRVARTPDPLGAGDDAVVLSLGEVEVFVDDAVEPIVILTQPRGGRIEVGSSYELAVEATGPDPLGYQWKKDGGPLAGKTAATLLLEDLKFADGGSYTVVVSGGGQQVESDPAVLVVTRVNLARKGLAVQSTEFGPAMFPASLATDGDYGNFTATDPTDPAPTWEVDLGGDVKIDEVIVFNRGDGCCPSRLRDIVVSVCDVSFLVDPSAPPLFESDILNEENVLGGGAWDAGPASLEVKIEPAVTGRFIRVARIPDPDFSGSGGIGTNDDVSILSIGETEVHGDTTGFCPASGPEFADSHCLGLTVVGPPEGGPGIHTVTAQSSDATGDALYHTFRADNGFTPPVEVGPVLTASADLELSSAASWTVSAKVDDSLLCADEAGDAECTETVEVPQPEGPNKALLRPVRQSSEWAGGLFPASRAVNGDLLDFTATAADDSSATLELDLVEEISIVEILIHNRGDGCCQSRLRDITVSILAADGQEILFQTELLNPENVLGGGTTAGPPVLDVAVSRLADGPVTGRFVRIQRAPDPDFSGSAGQVSPEEANLLSIGEVEVYDTECGPGEARCQSIDVAGPEGNLPGTYTVTATATGSTVFYTFTADSGQDPPLAVGPQELPVATFDLGPGTWTISVTVSDSPRCPATVPGATCSSEVAVEALCAGTNLALAGSATQSSEFGGFPAALGIDGDPATFTATSPADAAPTWEVDLGGTRSIASVVAYNRVGCCPERLRDITVSILDDTGVEIEFQSDLLNPANTLGGPPYLVLDLIALTGNRVAGRFVRIQRTPDAGGLGEDAAVLSLSEVQICDGSTARPQFRRADANADGATNITDGIFVLNYLFLGGPKPTCLEAADANNDGTINITDGIFILNYLFLGGPRPPAPGPAPGSCGEDPDPAGGPKDIGCSAYTKCA